MVGLGLAGQYLPTPRLSLVIPLFRSPPGEALRMVAKEGNSLRPRSLSSGVSAALAPVWVLPSQSGRPLSSQHVADPHLDDSSHSNCQLGLPALLLPT